MAGCPCYGCRWARRCAIERLACQRYASWQSTGEVRVPEQLEGDRERAEAWASAPPSRAIFQRLEVEP